MAKINSGQFFSFKPNELREHGRPKLIQYLYKLKSEGNLQNARTFWFTDLQVREFGGIISVDANRILALSHCTRRNSPKWMASKIKRKKRKKKRTGACTTRWRASHDNIAVADGPSRSCLVVPSRNISASRFCLPENNTKKNKQEKTTKETRVFTS